MSLTTAHSLRYLALAREGERSINFDQVRSFDDYMGVGILINKLNCFWNKLTWTIYYLPVTKKTSFLSKFFSWDDGRTMSTKTV